MFSVKKRQTEKIFSINLAELDGKARNKPAIKIAAKWSHAWLIDLEYHYLLFTIALEPVARKACKL